MEGYLGNQQGFLNEADPYEKMAFNDAQKVVDRIDNIHYIEASLFSYKVGMAGSVDCIAEYDGVPSVIDFKTSSKLKKEEWIQNYFEQCTAYSLMYQDMTSIKIPQVVVIISVDHEIVPQVFVKNRIEYVESLAQKVKEYRRTVS
jgi:genome maintenance exonuclease 1